MAIVNGIGNYLRNNSMKAKTSATQAVPSTNYVPPAREVYGRIKQIGRSDPEKASRLLYTYTSFLKDPSSPFYNSYSQPTNKAVTKLQGYGFDISNLTNGWLDTPDAQAYIRSNLDYRSSTGNTPSTPTKSSTLDQRIAYELNQYLISEDNTKKAEKEYQGAIKEAQYWANAKDRNYSDQEVINKVRENFASKYPTLAKMETSGNTPFELNRSVMFSDDILYGAIWAARNPGYNGTIENAMASSYLSDGNQWVEDPSITAKLNAGNLETYAPYSVGSTMEEERAYFGRDSFDKNWVMENRSEIINSGDETAIKYLGNIVEGIDYTDKLNSQLKEMRDDIDYYVNEGYSADDIIDLIKHDDNGNINSAYKDLFALDDTLLTTELKNTTSAVNYRWRDIENEIRERCGETKKPSTTEYLDTVSGISNPPKWLTEPAVTEYTNTDAQEKANRDNLNTSVPAVTNYGTDEEKVVFDTGKTTSFGEYADELSNLEIEDQKGATAISDKLYEDTASSYMGTLQTLYDYENNKTALDNCMTRHEFVMGKISELQEKYDFDNPDPSIDMYELMQADNLYGAYVQEAQDLREEIGERNKILADTQEAYDAARIDQQKLYNTYAVTGDIAQNAGVDFNSEMPVDLECLFGAMQAWTPSQWSSYSVWDAAVREGEMTLDEAYADASATYTNIESQYRILTRALKEADQYGIPITPDQRRNVQQNLNVLKREMDQAGDLLLRNRADFDEVADDAMNNINTENMSDITQRNVKALTTGEFTDWLDEHLPSLAAVFNINDDFKRQFWGHDPSNDLDYAGQLARIDEMLKAVTDEEKKEYFYLLKTEGEDSANQYFQRLTDPKYGVLQTRFGENYEKMLQEFAESGGLKTAVGYASTFITNQLGNIQSWITGKVNDIKGEEANPYGAGYMGTETTNALRLGTSERIKNDLDPDRGKEGHEKGKYDDAVDFWFNAISSAGDSAVNAIMTSAGFDMLASMIPAFGKFISFLGKAGNGEIGGKLSGLVKVAANAGRDFAHALPMAMGAAQQAARSAQLMGATPDQIKGMYYTTLFAESVSEAITYGNISGMFKAGSDGGFSNGLKEFIKGIFKNGMEEAAGEGFNQWWEDHNERIIMGELSQYNKMYAYYHDELGLPSGVAEEMVAKEMIKSIGLAAASGFISSGVSSSVSYGAGRISDAKYNNYNKKITTQDLTKIRIATGRSNTDKAVAASGVLRSIVQPDEADAAGQHIIFQNDDGLNMLGDIIYAANERNLEAKRAVSYATLTKGRANEELNRITEKYNNGESITRDDVTALIEAANEDMNGENAEELDKQRKDAIIENRIAARTRDKQADPARANKLNNAKKAVTNAKQSADEAAQATQDAQEHYDTVSKLADDAVADALNNPIDENSAPVEQLLNEKNGADRDVATAEKTQAEREEDLKKAQDEQAKVQEEILAESRAEAQQEVAQEVLKEEEIAAQQEQAEFDAAVATYNPSVPFKKPMAVYFKNGVKSQFLGGFGITPSGQIIWATTNGYVTDNEIDWEKTGQDSKYSQTAIDKVINQFSQDNYTNTVKPYKFFNHSRSAFSTDNDVNVNLIGLAGQTQDGDYVYMDNEGNLYAGDNLAFNSDPFTGESGMVSQYNATKNVNLDELPVITREELFRREHPEINLPERFVQYPNGPVTVKDQAGNDQIIIGIDANYNSGEPLFYVLDDGNEIPAYAIAEEPSDFTAWWMNEVGEQALPEEGQQDDITALVSSEALGYNGFKAPEGTIGYDLNNEEVTILGLYDYDGDLAYLVQREGMEPEFIEESKILPIKNHKWAMKAIDEIETKIDQQFALSTDESVMPSDKPTGITYGDWSSPYGIKTNTIYPENFKSCEVTTGEGDGEYPVKLEGIYVTNTGDIVFTSENGPMWVEDINPVSENAADFFNWAIDVAKNELANPERGNSSTQDNINNFITSINNLLTGDTKTELVSDTLVNGNETLMGYSAPEGVKALLFGSTVNVKGMYKDSHGKYYLKMDTPGNNIIPWSEATILPDSDPTRWAQTAYAELDNTSGSVISTSPETPSFGQPTTVVLPNGDDAKGYEAPHPMPAKTVAGFDVTVKGVYKSGNKYVYDVGSGFAGYNNISLTNADDALWVYKAVTAIDNGGSQNQSVSLQNEDNSILNATTLNKTKKVTEADGTTHTLKLKDWQNEKFHGPVKQAIKKENPKSKKFKEWQNLEGMEVYDSQGNKLPLEKYEKYFNDSQGAKKYYRGYGDFGHNLYVTHESKGGTSHDGTPYSVNFYMDKFSTASSYAGTNKVVQLRYIQNWETAKEAMKDIGLDLVETVQSGTPGYLVVKPLANGQVIPSDTKSGNFFKENELAKFRNTYGGNPKHKGIHVGYLTGNKVLVIDGLHSGYYEVAADVTLPNGLHLQDIDKTRNWAKWVFKNSDVDTIIFDQVQDNVSGGGEFGVEIVTRYSPQFKSIWNKGSYSSTNPNILAMKIYPSNAKAYKEKLNGPSTFKATGEPLSAGFENFRYDLENGKDLEDMTPEEKKAIVENFKKTPEYRYANAHTTDESTLPWSMTTAIRMFDGSANSIKGLEAAGVPEETINMLLDGATYSEAVESLFTPEDVSEIYRIRDLMATENGSPVLDSNGEISSYTGPVAHNKQLHLIIGLPGSGKSTLANPLAQQEQARILDPDIAKTEHRKNTEGGNDGLLHNESRYITSLARNIMVENGDNVVYPIVGSNYGSVIRDIQDFRDAGYDITVHRVDIPWNKSVLRAVNRLAEKNRNVDIEYLTGESDAGISPVRIKENFNKLIEEGIANGGYAVWNNDVERGEPPIPTEYSDEKAVSITGGAFGNSEGYSEGNGGRGANGLSEQPSLQALRVTKTPVKKNLTPTEKQASKIKTKLKSPQQIAKTLVKSLGFGDYLGSNDFGTQRGAGYWDTHAQLAAVKNAHLGNITVTAHEIGHVIAQRLGIRGTNEMVDNLIASNPDFAEKYHPNELRDESFAEFLWRYLVDDQLARDFAGNQFVNDFESRLSRDAGTRKAIKEAQNSIRMWLNADLDARTESLIRYENSKDKVPFREMLRTLTNRNVDSTAIADAIDKFVEEESGERGKLRLQGLFANHSQRRTVTNLTDSLTDAESTIIGKGLGARLADVGFKGTAENIRLLEKYALWLHSLDRDAQGKPVFSDDLTTEERIAKIKEIQRTRPDIVKAEQAWQEFRHEFLQAWMVDTGYWSQEFLDHLEEMYPHYVPTFRVGGTAENQEMTGFGRSQKKYTLKGAKGSTQDIYSPMYSFIGMVDQITSMVNQNQVARLFDKYYEEYEGMGEFARQIPGKEDVAVTPEEGKMNARQREVEGLLDGEISDDLMEKVLDVLKSNPGVNNRNNGSELVVQREDGTTVRYEIHDKELYKLLAGVQGSTGIRTMQAIGKLTRTMSMLTTGSNPLFAARNAVRDYQNSVNYGSWASNYLSGIPKWISALRDVAKNADIYKEYQALGGGGWTRIERNNSKSMSEITSEMFGDDRSTVGKTAKWLGKKLWNTVTMERLNEIIEQTSRLVEYKYGQHDRSTAEGRKEAFQAAQDVTVDFSRSGNSETAYVLKKLVPFFGASLQGVYRTGRTFTEAERGRLGARLTKTVVNTALASALAAGLVLRDGDKDDKEEFMMLSDGVKANHLILPNPLKGLPNQPPFLRIPLAQDPISYAIHSLVTNAMVNGSDDEMAISLAATADVILDNLNPLGSGTIFQPYIDVSHNRTWYGSSLVRTSQQEWTDKSSQYNEDTPEIFKTIGRLTGTSPEVVEYLASQYTGFIGAMAIPALSIEDDGSVGGFDAIMNSIIKKWTADPLSSNEFTQNFYNMKSAITTITGEAEADRPQGLLLRSLTQDEVNQAYEEAKAMTSAGGIVYETSKLISSAYKKIDQINSNNTLTDEDKYKLTHEVKTEMLDQVALANAEMQAYYKKYIQGETLIDRTFGAIRKRLEEGKYAHVKTDVERLPSTFQNDMNSDYMQKALSVWNGDKEGSESFGYHKAAALPHPSYTFTKDNVEYTIPESERDTYNDLYKKYYEQYLNGNAKGSRGYYKWSYAARDWDKLSDEDQYTVLKEAAEYANGKMKDAYLSKSGNSKRRRK